MADVYNFSELRPKIDARKQLQRIEKDCNSILGDMRRLFANEWLWREHYKETRELMKALVKAYMACLAARKPIQRFINDLDEGIKS